MPWRKEVLVLQEDWSALEFELLPFVHLQWLGQLQCAATCAGIASVPFGSSLEGCACWVFWCLGEFSLFFCYVFSTFHSPICPLAQLPLSSTSWVSSILASFETQLQKTAAVGNVCVCRHHVFNFFRTCVTVSSIFVISNIFHDTLPPFFFGDSWLLTDSWCHASNMGVFSKRCVATSTFSRSWVACIFFCCFCLIILHAVNLCFKRLGLS